MKVQILLSTYNGELYLEEQLKSLFQQKGVDISILIRDDGSTDSTHTILNYYQNKGLLTWYTGNNLRPSKSFFHLLKNTPIFDYYAFCDQDDVWHPDKLISAIEKLESFPEQNKPLLYFCNKNIVDVNLNYISHKSREFTQSIEKPFFENYAAGCCMVFNESLRKLVIMHSPTIPILHDKWMFITANILGHVIYDDTPHMNYRQHNNNVVGSKHENLRKKIYYLLKQREKSISTEEIVTEFVNQYRYLLSDSQKKRLIRIVQYKNSLRAKLYMLFSHKYQLDNKSIFANIYLKMKILFSRL